MGDGRWKCEECYWVGPQAEVLEAPNPFDNSENIWGCPNCLEANRLERACDHEGCDLPGGNGTMTPDGYTWTCFAHRPKPPAAQRDMEAAR